MEVELSLAGAPESIVRLLRRKFAELAPDDPLRDFEIATIAAAQMRENIDRKVTIFTYRVDLDSTRRRDELPPVAPRGPPRSALALELRVLLTVWGQTAAGELQVLGKCMEILDEHPILTGDDLDPTFPWLPGAAVMVGIDSLSTENLLQLWDALTPSFRLSVPYRLRTIRLKPRLGEAEVPVDAVVRTYTESRGSP